MSIVISNGMFGTGLTLFFRQPTKNRRGNKIEKKRITIHVKLCNLLDLHLFY